MKITFLGTAAAEGIPALFCSCDTCKKAIKLGGKNIRTRSQSLIDNDLLIDYPSDSYFHFIKNKIDMTKIKNCLITHAHEDHFYIKDFYNLSEGFSHPKDDFILTMHGTIDLKKDYENVLKVYPKAEKHFKFNQIEAFKTYKIDSYEVTTLKAEHGTDHPLTYIIKKDNKTILYFHDSGIISKQTLDFIASKKFKFDLVSLDCCYGAVLKISYIHHMCLGDCIKMKNMFLDKHIANKNTIFVLNHFSHNSINVLHNQITKEAKKYGFIASYDGLEINL